jgi:hypothetical protein
MNVLNPTRENQGCALLEEWPTSPRKRVSFSKYSNMRTFQIRSSSGLCYSREERRGFQLQALEDAASIKQLIESCPYEGSSAIRHLLTEKKLEPENLIGIEQLVYGARRVAKERHRHTEVVLEAQRELNSSFAKLQDQHCEIKCSTQDSGIDISLARISSQRSLKSAQKASLRAILAAN